MDELVEWSMYNDGTRFERIDVVKQFLTSPREGSSHAEPEPE